MRIQTGDKVIVIAGKDKGQGKDKVIAKVKSVDKKKKKVVVEGVNIRTKHQKAKSATEPGGIIKIEGPIDVSNIMFYDEKTKSGSRIGYKFENGKKVRFSKKSGEIIK